MYHFVVVALLALATLKVADLVVELVPGISRFYSMLIFALGVTFAVAIGYSLFGGYGIGLRESGMGTWVTGLLIGGLAAAWRTVLGFLGHTDTRDVERTSTGRPRVAA